MSLTTGSPEYVGGQNPYVNIGQQGTANTGGISYTPPEFQQSSSSPWSNLGMAGLAGLLTGSGNTAATVLAGLGASDQMGNISATQQNYANTINSMMNQLPSQVEFKPYTVTSGLGTSSTTPTGGVTSALGGQQQALSNAALGGSQGFIQQAQRANPMLGAQAGLFGTMLGNYQGNPAAAGIGSLANQYAGLAGQAGQGLLQDTASREQDIYNRIRATQTPEEQRAQSALEERLAAQGRLGISTNQYGGTPEQLAISKAREEAKNSAMLSAMQQAGAERQQDLATATGLTGLAGNLATNLGGLNAQDIQNQLGLAGGSQEALAQQLGLQKGYGQLGAGMMQMGYTPYEQMRADFAMSQMPSQLAAAGRDTGVGLLAQLGLGGLAEQTKLETLRNNLLNQMYQTAGGLFSGQGGTAGTGGIASGSVADRALNWLGDNAGDAWDWLKGQLNPSGTWEINSTGYTSPYEGNTPLINQYDPNNDVMMG